MSEPGDNSNGPPGAVRLIFEYDGDRIALIGRYPADVELRHTDLEAADRPGIFVESRATGGQRLARVAAGGAFVGGQEVFPEHPGQPFARVEQAPARGAFQVLLPADSAADHVAVVQVAPAVFGPAAPGPASPDPASRGPAIRRDRWVATAPDLRTTDLASFPLLPHR